MKREMLKSLWLVAGTLATILVAVGITPTVAAAVGIAPVAATVAPGGQQQFAGNTGTPPYTFSLVGDTTGGATINPNV